MNTPGTTPPHLAFRPSPTIVSALIPHITPGVVALRLSDGRPSCIGMGGPAPGLRPAHLQGLGEDEAREVVEHHEAAYAGQWGMRRTRKVSAERWAAPTLRELA